jgi:multicomponent Na+:H+ antiporter subunit D
MAVGALGALSQTSIRRVLGYSIVSSIGYMILGLAVATPLAITGALFYLFQDILVKANLFLGAGAANRLAGSEEFGKAGGLWRFRPWFSLLFLLPALSLAGVPPFSGFWAKLLLARATIEAGSYGLTFMVLAVGFLTLFAMARIWAAVFWTAHPEGDGAITARLPAAMLVPLVVLTGLIIYVGIDAGRMVDGVAAIAGGLIDPQAYVAAVLGGAQ